MKNIVIIASAIHTNYGIYTKEQRIDQTINSINSVRNFIPNSVIILFDNSKLSIKSDTSESLKYLISAVDYYVDNSADKNIQYFHENVENYDVGKNVMEALGMYTLLHLLLNNSNFTSLLESCTRIFKLSGRYEISKNFNIDNFVNNTKNKYIFKEAQKAWINPSWTGVDTLYQTRLWSFCPSQLHETILLYKNIIDNMLDTLNKGEYIDLEHSMSKFLPKDRLIELKTIGVKGNIAPNGAFIDE